MKYLSPLLAFILLFSISCDTSSSEDLDKNEILDILDSIQLNFNMHLDPDDIMQYYNQNFNHNGDDFDFERIRWEIRLNDYNDLIFENIEINLNGNYATANFLMHLDETATDEPSDENGDISYFYRELGNWKLCGDNFIVSP